jgi:hypothetical protein
MPSARRFTARTPLTYTTPLATSARSSGASSRRNVFSARGGDDDQRLSPAGPESGQAGPEQAVSRAELQPGCFDGGHILQRLAVRLAPAGAFA